MVDRAYLCGNAHYSGMHSGIPIVSTEYTSIYTRMGDRTNPYKVSIKGPVDSATQASVRRCTAVTRDPWACSSHVVRRYAGGRGLNPQLGYDTHRRPVTKYHYG